jgi:hypothetical protein
MFTIYVSYDTEPQISGPLSSGNFQRTQTDEGGWSQHPVWTRWRISSASAGITTQAI